MLFLRRFYSDKGSSALKERFQQIIDEKLSTSNHSSITSNPELAKAYKTSTILKDEKLADLAQSKSFEQRYQREIELVRSQSKYKNVERIQLDSPWTGTENITDTASRMLLDSLPRAKSTGYQKTIITPAVGFKQRIEGAKDGALDYKVKPQTDKEKDDFRELYKERLLGPSMLVDSSSPTATLGLIGGLADSRINAAIDRKTGKFESGDMNSVRGKPLDKKRLANCLDTNFFLNEILNKQECLPPWIENQQGVERELSHFRNELNKTLFVLMLDTLNSKCGKDDEKIKATMKDGPASVCEAVSRKYLSEHSRYFSAKVKELNRGIRNYNLQCPTGALHKWKVVEEKELADRLDQLTLEFPTLFKEYQTRKSSQASSAPPPKSRFSSWRKGNDSSEGSSVSMWKSIRNIFTA